MHLQPSPAVNSTFKTKNDQADQEHFLFSQFAHNIYKVALKAPQVSSDGKATACIVASCRSENPLQVHMKHLAP